jgi:hypothetical protein
LEHNHELVVRDAVSDEEGGDVVEGQAHGSHRTHVLILRLEENWEVRPTLLVERTLNLEGSDSEDKCP